MIAFPAGTKVWIATGVTDMRCGMNSLSLKVHAGLGRDPCGGEIFCFRGRKADMAGGMVRAGGTASDAGDRRDDGRVAPQRPVADG